MMYPTLKAVAQLVSTKIVFVNLLIIIQLVIGQEMYCRYTHPITTSRAGEGLCQLGRGKLGEWAQDQH